LEEFIDKFIAGGCIASVRPLSHFPTAYSFPFILCGFHAYHLDVVLANSQILWTSRHLCILHFIPSRLVAFSRYDPFSRLLFCIFLGWYLIVTCLLFSCNGGINTVVKLGDTRISPARKAFVFE